MADARRIVLLDAADRVIRVMDVSDVDHANTLCMMSIAVETRCDLGEWHRGQRAELRPWGNRVRP